MVIPSEAIESVAMANVKTIAEAPAVLTNLMLANAVAHQQAQQSVELSITSKAAELLITTDISESGGLSAILQMLTKTAQTTPPVTP